MESAEFQLSKHAKERIEARKISRNSIYSALDKPDNIIEETDCKHIYQKSFVKSKKGYLLRIFVNVCKEPKIIITAYKTSKTDKYDY